jgi:hypothetical protein
MSGCGAALVIEVGPPRQPATRHPGAHADAPWTAVTRAKRLVVLAGSRKALAVAVRTGELGLVGR